MDGAWAAPLGAPTALHCLLRHHPFPLAIALVVVLLWFGFRQLGVVTLVRKAPAYGFIVRAVWLFIAVSGLVALVNDIGDLT